MPIHDWSRVEAGIFHDFHHAWIEEIKRALNHQLPGEFYALAEQRAGGLGPDVLTLQHLESGDGCEALPGTTLPESNGTSVSVAPPPVALTAETDAQFYRRKQNRVVIRHVTGDEVIAVVEVVSPGNKSSESALRSFVTKSIELLEQDIHLVVLDVNHPGRFDPAGIHGAIWQEYTGEPYELPNAQSLTFASYEASGGVRAYVQHACLGESVPEVPLFLLLRMHLMMRADETYNRAFDALPRRWQSELQS